MPLWLNRYGIKTPIFTILDIFSKKNVTCFAFMAQIVSNRVTSKIKIFNANWFHLSFALFELFPQRLSFCSFWALSVILILSSYAKPSQSQTGITKSETFHARLPQTALLHVLTSSSFSFLFYTGNVMQYFLIALFALIMVLVVLISSGAWFG